MNLKKKKFTYEQKLFPPLFPKINIKVCQPKGGHYSYILNTCFIFHLLNFRYLKCTRSDHNINKLQWPNNTSPEYRRS